MADMETAVGSVLDIAGVVGAFIVSRAGELVAWNMPNVLSEEALEEVGVKVARLVEAFGMSERQLETCVVRYTDHKLCVRMGPSGGVCVLAEPRVNMPALRMGIRLVFRHWEQAVKSSGAETSL